jgi:MtN3 and saliva related transmembrane protein
LFFIVDVMTSTEYIGIAAGICTSISLLPQLIKLIKEKNARDLSITYLIILLVGLVLWVWYGIRQEDLPIVITNAFAAALNVAILVVGLKFKNDK